MRIFSIFYEAGHRERFAACYVAESVRVDPRDKRCPECLEPVHVRRLDPFTIAWEPGSDVIADFVYYSGNVIVTDRVKQAFEDTELRGYVAWPVKIKERSKPKKRHRWPIVPSPYGGPPLWDIYTESLVHLIPEASSLEYNRQCPKCGARVYSVLVQEPQFFLVDRASWDGADFMLPYEAGGFFVTERVIEVIEQHDFSNVTYRHIEISAIEGSPPDCRPAGKVVNNQWR